jgi:hypothetical protein
MSIISCKFFLKFTTIKGKLAIISLRKSHIFVEKAELLEIQKQEGLQPQAFALIFNLRFRP